MGERSVNDCRRPEDVIRTKTHFRSIPQPLNLITRFVFILIGLYMGVSVALPGATLIYLERFTSSREDEVALIFSARAVGSLSGWLLGVLVLDMRGDAKPTGLLGIGSAGLCLVYFLLPMAAQIWWNMVGFVFQGCCMALTTTGCLAYARAAFLHSKPHWAQHLLFACLLGCVLTPFITLPFFPQQVALPQPHSLSSFVPENISSVNKIAAVNRKVILSSMDISKSRRLKRSINITNISSIQPVTHSSQSLLLSSTVSTAKPITTPSPANSRTPLVPTSYVSGEAASDNLTAPPTKPLVNDAKHLNQDSSSADGSQTASKLKQLGEDRRIDKVGGAPGLPAVSTGNAQTALEPSKASTSEEKSNVVVTASTAKAVSLNQTSTRSPPNHTNVTASVNHGGRITVLVNNQSSGPIAHSTPALPLTKSVLVKVLDTSIAASRSASISSHEIATPHTIRNISVQRESTTPPPTKPPRVPGTVPSTSPTYEHIAEHRSSVRPTHHFSFSRPLWPIQRLYLFTGLMGLLLWLLLLPLIGWCPSFCKCFHSSSARSTDSDEFRLRRLQSPSSPMSNGLQKVNGSEHDMERHPLLPDEDEQLPDYEDTVHVYQRDASTNESHYLSAREETTVFSDSELMEQHKAPTESNSFLKRSPPTAPVPLSSMAHNPDYSNTAPSVPVVTPEWPRVHWPTDAWLLLAQFFNIGLETTYGAFIHWFAMRYLLWNPAVASLALSIFWLGGLVGRLPGLFLVETKLSSHSNRGTHSDTSQSGRSWTSLLSSSTHWLLSMVRLCGAVLCVISAVAITRLSVSTARYKLDSIIPIAPQRPVSRNYFTWLGGSLFLGLGVGVSSSGVDSLLVVQPSDDIHRLQLAGHLGQMLVPPIVAYLHHLAVFRRYTYVLGTSVLLLSILLSFVLVADVLQAALCRSRERRSTSRMEIVSPSKSDGTSSPVTLHTVEHP